MRQIALNITAILFALFVVGGAAAQPLGPDQGRVINIKGSLSLKRAELPARALGLNDTVATGDQLVTDAQSEADVQTADGASVHIYPDSRVVFSGNAAGFADFLHLIFGSIKIHVEKLSGRPNPHSLTTPTAVIAVRGTTFSVFVDDADATMVAVDEGMVAVANRRSPRDEVVLRPGQRTWVRGDRPPLKAQKFRGRSEHADMMAGKSGMGMNGNSMNAPGMGHAMDAAGSALPGGIGGMAGMSGRAGSHR